MEKISVVFTRHLDRKITLSKDIHPIVGEVVVYDKPHDSVFEAKLEAVKLANYEWVVLLDSDDSFDESFFEILAQIQRKEDRLYCPEKALPYSFIGYSDYLYNTSNMRYSIDEGNFMAFMICGSYFFKKEKYVQACQVAHYKIWRNDCFYLKYLWLASGGSLQIVKGLNYEHNSKPDGVMATYATEIWNELDPLKKKILLLEKMLQHETHEP